VPIASPSTSASPGAKRRPLLVYILEHVGTPDQKSDQKSPEMREPVSAQSATPRKRRTFLWILLVLVLTALSWSIFSSSPFAQPFQEFLGWKHDEIVVDKSFSVLPRSFRYYKFTLPAGSKDVALLGQFSSIVSPQNSAAASSSGAAGDIEVLVLNESAFALWHRGEAVTPIYSSGRTSKAKVRGDLPAGAGTYYIIFSNRGDASAAKAITATFSLRQKTWLPESLRQLHR
jgi:hypothetical protein